MEEKREMWDEDEPQIPLVETVIPYFSVGDHPMSKVSEIDESNYDTGSSPLKEGEMQFTFFNRK